MKTTLDIKNKDKSIKLSRCKARYKDLGFSFVDGKQDIYGNYFALFRGSRTGAGYGWKENGGEFKLIKDGIEIDSIEGFFTSVQLINESVFYVEYTSGKDGMVTIKKDGTAIKESMKSIYKLDIPTELLGNSVRFLGKSINGNREVHLDDETFILDNESIYGDGMDLYTSPNGKFFIFTGFESTSYDSNGKGNLKGQKNQIIYSNTLGLLDKIDISKYNSDSSGYINQSLLDNEGNYVLALSNSGKDNGEGLIFNGSMIYTGKVRMDKFNHSLDKNFSFTFTLKDNPVEGMSEMFYIDSKGNIVNFPSENKNEFWIKSRNSDKWAYHKILDNEYVDIDGKKFKRNLLN